MLLHCVLCTSEALITLPTRASFTIDLDSPSVSCLGLALDDQVMVHRIDGRSSNSDRRTARPHGGIAVLCEQDRLIWGSHQLRVG